jgi:hypothetical protein
MLYKLKLAAESSGTLSPLPYSGLSDHSKLEKDLEALLDAHRGEDPRIHPAPNSAELTNEGPAGHRPARVRPVDVDVLRTAIERILGHRATHPVPTELPYPPGAWAPVYARTNQPETQVGPASKTRCDPPHLSTPTSGV